MAKYLILWVPMLLFAIANGALRDLVYKKYTGELAANQISTVTLMILFGCYIGYIIHRFPPSSESKALIIGFIWLVLTLGFEFGFGRWRGNSWAKLFADYNLFEGRIWLLIPIFVAIAPYLFYKFLK
jgi:hypothetical protein